MRIRRGVFGREREEAEAAARGHAGRDVALAVCIGAGELDQRYGRTLRIERSGDVVGRAALRLGHRRRLPDGDEQRLQARIQIVHAGEVMQHALVDPQARADERAIVHGLEQAPAP